MCSTLLAVVLFAVYLCVLACWFVLCFVFGLDVASLPSCSHMSVLMLVPGFCLMSLYVSCLCGCICLFCVELAFF